MQAGDVLAVLKATGALLEGHFELRSGLHSDRYFQCANVLRYPRHAEALCRALVEKLRAGRGGELAVDGVIAPALGGILVGHEIARALDVRSIFAEKQDGKLALRRFAIRPGERYLVAEDVITRGGRVQETIDLVEQAGGRVRAVAVLVDRSGGRVRFAYPLFSLLEMAPTTYEPGACPWCARGVPFVHPGS
jgi:orotate phosphoribosyltransferase